MDYGIKASRRGYDVKKARDNQLVFDSDFPTLKIILDDSFTIPADDGETYFTICEHNLGFYPFWLAFGSDDTYPARKIMIASPNMRMNNKELFWNGYTDGFSGHYFIFDFDLEDKQKIEYSKKGSGVESDEESKKENYVIQISKKGDDVKKTPKEKLAYSTEFREPLIHVADWGNYPGGWEIKTIYHNLGYPPQSFLYIKNLYDDNSYQLTLGSSDDFFTGTTDDSVSFAHGYLDSGYSLLVLKDPLKS